MSVQHRAHIEELQRYCQERDDLINELESKMVSNDDSVKIYKKNLDDEIELHRQDKISLQRVQLSYNLVLLIIILCAIHCEHLYITLAA